MAENPAGNNGNANNRKKSNNSNFFRMRHRFQNNRDTGPKQRTVSILIPQPSTSPRPSTSSSESTSDYTSSSSSGPTVPSTSFQISKKNGPYAGWQLYFPDVGMFLVRI